MNTISGAQLRVSKNLEHTESSRGNDGLTTTALLGMNDVERLLPALTVFMAGMVAASMAATT